MKASPVQAEVAPAASRRSGLTPHRLSMAAALLLALAWPWLPEFTITLLNTIALAALAALGLVLLAGVAGMTSFGQAAFIGIGAYATGWLCTAGAQVLGLGGLPPALLPWFGLLLGLGITALAAYLLGAITLQLSGHYLPLGTIAWGISLYFLFGNLGWLGGHTGLGGIPPLTFGGLSLASPRLQGALIWALLLLAMWALHNLLDSREGRAIRALRGGRLMAESMGVDTHRLRIRVFVLAALLAALSGWLYAHLQRFVNPTPFSLGAGIELLFMVVLGGAGHLGAALLGAALITLVEEQLQDVLPGLLRMSGNFEGIVFGLLMIAVLQRFGGGLWPALGALGRRFGVVAAPPADGTVRLPAAAVASLPHRDLPPRGSLLLEARGIGKRFGGLVANEAIDLDLKAGEVHALIGPNGAGKSTFFDIVSGVSEPSTGEVRLAGVTMHGRRSRDFAAAGLARSFQQVRLLGGRSVLENVALGAHRRGGRGWLAAMLRLDRREEAALLAEARRQLVRCGLGADAAMPAASLALGRQRLVEIARALAAQPTALLLDEPAAGLRRPEKQALAALLDQLRSEGLGILVVEHDMDFVMNLADRVTVLEFGRVIASGSPAAVQVDPRVLEAYLGVGDEAPPGEPSAQPPATAAPTGGAALADSLRTPRLGTPGA